MTQYVQLLKCRIRYNHLGSHCLFAFHLNETPKREKFVHTDFGLPWHYTKGGKWSHAGTLRHDLIDLSVTGCPFNAIKIRNFCQQFFISFLTLCKLTQVCWGAIPMWQSVATECYRVVKVTWQTLVEKILILQKFTTS